MNGIYRPDDVSRQRQCLRTTLDIDDGVLAVARAPFRGEGRSLGWIVSELARRGVAEGHSTCAESGLPTFDVRPDALLITPEVVLEAMDDA